MSWYKGSPPKPSVTSIEQANTLLEKLRVVCGAFDEDEIKAFGECIGFIAGRESAIRECAEMAEKISDRWGNGCPCIKDEILSLLSKKDEGRVG